jgi:hypothetical protein
LSQIGTGERAARPDPASDATTRVTRALLACGVVGGPLFIVAGLIQAFTRPGFDLRRHALSMLSLGDLGWIQIANFELTGVLIVGLAVGMRRALHPGPAGTWGPPLMAAYGVGFLVAGVFRIDPALGFPPGAPEGFTGFSWHADVHFLGFTVAFVSLIAACFVFARRFAGMGEGGWALYSLVSGALALVLIVIGMVNLVPASESFAVMGLVTAGWIAAISVRLLGERASAAS